MGRRDVEEKENMFGNHTFPVTSRRAPGSKEERTEIYARTDNTPAKEKKKGRRVS